MSEGGGAPAASSAGPPRSVEPRASSGNARIPEYDVARWIAIAAVVFVHASSFAVARDSVTLLGVMNRVARFGVPTFLFVAAALAWGSNAPLTWQRWSRFMARRARLAWLPYAVWTLAYVLPDLLSAGRAAPALRRIAVALLTGNAAPHLYFVPLVSAVWLLAPIVGRVVRRAPGTAFAVGTVLSVLLRFWVLDAGAARTTVFGILLYAPAVLAGAWYDLRLPRSRAVLARWWPLLLAVGAGGVATVAARSLYWPLRWVAARLGWARHETIGLGAAVESMAHVVTVAGVAGLSGRLTAVRGRLSALAQTWAPLVFGAYLAHAVPVFGILVAARRFAPELTKSPSFVVVLAAVGLATSIGAARLIAASRYTCWIVGVSAPWPLRPRAGDAGEDH